MGTSASEYWMRDDRAQSGVAAARPASERFESEAMPHLNALFRTASRMLGDRERAQDVAQEVLLQAWKSFDRFETGTNCKAWLFKILFHCVQHQRRQWFRFPLLKEPSELAETAVEYSPPLPDSLTDAEILAALERLPATFRSVVLLVDVEELSYKEAADALRIPIGTVMSRLNRARRQLRQELNTLAGTYGIGGVGAERQRV